MFTNLKLAIYPARVKPSMAWQRDNQSCRARTGETGSVREGLPAHHLNHSNRPVRTRMPGGPNMATLPFGLQREWAVVLQLQAELPDDWLIFHNVAWQSPEPAVLRWPIRSKAWIGKPGRRSVKDKPHWSRWPRSEPKSRHSSNSPDLHRPSLHDDVKPHSQNRQKQPVHARHKRNGAVVSISNKLILQYPYENDSRSLSAPCCACKKPS